MSEGLPKKMTREEFLATKPTTYYRLEVLEPGRTDDPFVSRDSLTPFGAFAVGHLLTPDGIVGDDVLRIVGVEHLLMPIGEDLHMHTTRLYTEALPNTRAARRDSWVPLNPPA